MIKGCFAIIAFFFLLAIVAAVIELILGVGMIVLAIWLLVITTKAIVRWHHKRSGRRVRLPAPGAPLPPRTLEQRLWWAADHCLYAAPCTTAELACKSCRPHLQHRDMVLWKELQRREHA